MKLFHSMKQVLGWPMHQGFLCIFLDKKMQPLSYVVCHLCPMFLLTSFALNKMFNKQNFKKAI